MDEWIESSRIVKYPSEANSMALQLSRVEDIAEAAQDNSDENKNRGNDGGPTTVAELEHDEHEGMDESALREHEEVTKIKNIRNVLFGRYKIECWYFSPYPKEYYPDGPIDCLYICEFSFRFFREKSELLRYLAKPTLQRHPPGNEIYRDDNVSMFEVDGAVEKVYCQNLSYFAKLFLDHKTLYFDVDPFLFYVLCARDDQGFHPVGYFSKEKYSDLGYNLACILTFPNAQRRGYGRFLIAFSYELSKKEEKVGSPEKPLSDLGAISYKSYWASTLLNILRNFPGDSLSVMDLSKLTSIATDDVMATLQSLGLLRNVGGTHVIYAPPEVIFSLMQKYPTTGLLVDPEKLYWAPLYVCDFRKDKWSIRGKKDSIIADEL
jgi:histone acetyltransferase MYST1